MNDHRDGTTSVRQLVVAFYGQLWNQQDSSRLHHILSPTFTFRGSLGLTKSGPEAFWDYVQLVVGALDDYRCDIEDLVVEGNRAFARMTFSGIHNGPFMGFQPTGRRIRWAGAALFTAESGRIEDLWVLGDLHGLREALDAED